ncbi:MAG: DUF6261 family protein [Tenuifilaceae bacterium]|jgi:hypothetical protein|nr:DUF6261 family protein [Tenuifilaceae bacterium]
MNAKKINLHQLRNEEHYQFMTEFRDSVTQFNAQTLNIAEGFAQLQTLYAQELEALQVVRKSATTEQLTIADAERDALFRGFDDSVKSLLNHFDPAKQQAAARLREVLDQYGNIARKTYDEETAAIGKLLVEATGALAADIATLGLTDWIAELDRRNQAFDALMKSRYAETSARTELRMREVRLEIDAKYRAITDRLDALMIINGDATYEPFVRELNARVDRYNDIIAQRRGRNAKDDSNTLGSVKQQPYPVIFKTESRWRTPSARLANHTLWPSAVKANPPLGYDARGFMPPLLSGLQLPSIISLQRQPNYR